MHQLSMFEGLQPRDTAGTEATAGLTQPSPIPSHCRSPERHAEAASALPRR